MALISRLTLTGPPPDGPEDFLSSSLGVIFPDDITNQHGDDEHGLLYASPHLPAHLPGSKARPFSISLAEPKQDDERRLFSHYLWNASLLLAELVEAGTLGLSPDISGFRPSEVNGFGAGTGAGSGSGSGSGWISDFDISGKSTIELGAGTALPSMFSALLGARSVAITDYPAPALMEILHTNIQRNVTQPSSTPSSSGLDTNSTSTSPLSGSFFPPSPAKVLQVEGHSWGELSTPFALANRHSFDRVLACDCLWMPWQHANLMRSIDWFLADDEHARAWVVAGFHTGRQKMRGFFEVDEQGCLAVADKDEDEDSKENKRIGRLEIESIWERDCDGEERPWVWDRGVEDVTERKRWLVVAVLRRKRKGSRGREGARASEGKPMISKKGKEEDAFRLSADVGYQIKADATASTPQHGTLT